MPLCRLWPEVKARSPRWAASPVKPSSRRRARASWAGHVCYGLPLSTQSHTYWLRQSRTEADRAETAACGGLQRYKYSSTSTSRTFLAAPLVPTNQPNHLSDRHTYMHTTTIHKHGVTVADASLKLLQASKPICCILRAMFCGMVTCRGASPRVRRPSAWRFELARAELARARSRSLAPRSDLRDSAAPLLMTL